MSAPPLTWLYVPADRPDRVSKALASPAHAVIVDLEDAVKPDAKPAARAALPSLLSGAGRPNVYVRVNAPGTPWHEDDVALAAGLGVGVLVAKVEHVEAIAGEGPVSCLLESALGIESAFVIASHARVRAVSLGELDLAGETGAFDSGLDWARARVVNAAVAAGLPRPPQSVYARLDDPEGLAESCRRGRTLGFLGRTAIHPAQLPVIERMYLPTADEVERARTVLARFGEAQVGAYADDGGFVDAAVVRSARLTVDLAEAYGSSAFIS